MWSACVLWLTVPHRWNNIELSDDDAEDCHPNIEKNTWVRLKREKREREKQEAEQLHAKEVPTTTWLG